MACPKTASPPAEAPPGEHRQPVEAGVRVSSPPANGRITAEVRAQQISVALASETAAPATGSSELADPRRDGAPAKRTPIPRWRYKTPANNDNHNGFSVRSQSQHQAHFKRQACVARSAIAHAPNLYSQMPCPPADNNQGRCKYNDGFPGHIAMLGKTGR
jgi:hypothetical protein